MQRATLHAVSLCAIISFCCGIAAQLAGYGNVSLALSAGLAGACWAALRGKRTQLDLAAWTLLASSAGFLYSHGWRLHNQVAYPSGRLEFEAKVVSTPRIKNGRISFTAIPQTPIGKGISGKAKGALAVTLPRYPEPTYGDILLITGKIEPPEKIGDFNYPLFLEEQGVYGTMFLPKVEITGRSNNLQASVFKLRKTWEERVSEKLPMAEASLLNGLLVGDRAELPQDMQDEFARTGTSHLVTMSGATITLAARAVGSLLPLRTRARQAGATYAVGIALTSISGFATSVSRGALMAATHAFLRSRGRKSWPLPLLGTCIFGMALWNPTVLSSVSFQLSCGAYAGLVWIVPLVERYSDKLRLNRMPEAVAETLVTSASVTLATAPISLLAFGEFSALGLLANPLLIWTVPYMLVAAIAHGVFTGIPLAGEATRFAAWLLAKAFLATVHSLAQVPVGTFQLGNHE